MSLHKFAEQVAANGRGDDSLLVHMTPDEVQRLQSFAEANGRSLTINPETGLPEAGILSDLFKAVAPIALGAFLGPAGMGLTFGGLSSAMSAGIATGGITALATGSLSRGLMAGLGAYGGAGLGEGLMGAATTGDAFQAAQSNLGPEANAMSVKDVAATANINPVTSGLKALGTEQGRAAALNAMGGTKGALTAAGMAAAPLMAMQPTTQMPETKGTGYIRQFDYNINPDTGKPDPLYGMRAMTPVKASEWGDKTFQGQRDLFRQQNPNPYELGTASLNQPPKPMAGGGIVALADGGVPGYADGMLVGDQDVFNYFKGLDQAKLGSGALDAQIAKDMQTYNVSAADIARITGTGAQQGDYEKRFVQAINPATLNSADFLAQTADVGLQNQALANAMQGAGMSQAAQYAATHQLNDAAGIASAPKAAQDFYNAYGYKAGDAPGDKGGIAGLYTNIDYAADRLQDQINAGKLTVQQAQNLSLAEMERLGINQADVKAATGKAFGDLFTPKEIIKPITPLPFTSVVPGGTQMPGATVYDNGAYGNYGSGPATGVDYRGNTVSIATPGDIITNPDDSRTVVPNIPGRPYGGFTGMEQVKSRYTAGGGSLGYTAKAPRTVEEFNQLYNKQTGDSLAAYDYLMGKGGGKYPVKSGVPNISQNYGEYVLGKKPVAPTAKPKTTEKTVAAGDAAVVGGVSFDLTDPTKQPAEDNNGPWSWDVAAKRWVQYGRMASGGMAGYAVGGGLGSLGSYSDGGRLLKGPGDGVSDSIPATIGAKNQPARLADGEFVIPARIVSELGNGSTDAGAKKLYAMMDRVQRARGKTTGKNKVAANSRSDKYLPA